MGISDNNSGDANQMALERFESSAEYAAAATASANTFLSNMASIMGNTPTIDPVAFTPSELIITYKDMLRPVVPDISMTVPTTPELPTIYDIVVGAISGIPSFDVPDPSVVFPETPTVDTIQDVGSIPSISDAVIPARPEYTVPSVPVFTSVSIPSLPDLNLPVFEGVMPVDDLNTPTNTFNFTEEMYGSNLLDAIKNKLESDIAAGGTGLGAAVEDAIWLREQERANIAAAEAKEKVQDDWENRGFNLPDGVVTASMLDIDLKLAADRATSSRDIAVKQAELALASKHFIIQQGIVLEGQLSNYASQMAQRTLEANKARIEMAVSIFNAEVAKFGIRLEGYKTQATVYESRIRASLATAELYKAQIEGAKLVTEQNLSLVELYKAQLSGIDSFIKLYISEMDAVKVIADIDRTKIEAFKAQIDAYSAKVQLNVAKFNMYEAAIKGESAKVQIYATKVGAYESRVKAASVEAQVVLDTAKIQSELQKTKVETYAAEIEAFKSLVQAEGIRINAIIDGYKGETGVYQVDGTILAAEIDAQVKRYQASVEQAIGQATVQVKNAEVQMNGQAHQAAVAAEMAKSAAQIAAQLAASAMAAIQTSIGIHDNTSRADNTNVDVAGGIRTIHQYNYSA